MGTFENLVQSHKAMLSILYYIQMTVIRNREYAFQRFFCIFNYKVYYNYIIIIKCF